MTWKYGEANESVGTLGATWTSGDFRVLGRAGVLLQFVVAANADAVGTIKVQGSNDGTTWDDIEMVLPDGTTSTTYAVASGVNSSFSALVGWYSRIRVVYTRTSGGAAATLSVVACRSRE
ncbi:MAG: hypothetical protein IPG96_16255 [Proteobacteria bacterium]|nr:hypothetical protein [Pseudomonadota bacterium]